MIELLFQVPVTNLYLYSYILCIKTCILCITETKKRFPCEMCGKDFTTRQILQRHMRIHTGERPYACNHCEKRFTQQAHLSNHMLKHFNFNLPIQQHFDIDETQCRTKGDRGKVLYTVKKQIYPYCRNFRDLREMNIQYK